MSVVINYLRRLRPQQTDMYPAATMEAATINTEQTYYGNLTNTQLNKPSFFSDPLYPTNAKVALVKNAAGNQKVGPNMVLKVMAGDSYNIRVASGWSSASAATNSSTNVMNDLLSLLSGSASSVSGGKATSAELQNTGSGLLAGITSFISTQTTSGTKPKAYINWIMLDEQFKYYGGGFEQVGASNTTTIHVRTNLTVTKNGYLYIYTSNEATNIDVFFDNLQVTHIRGPLVSEQHVYPFGLEMRGISSSTLNFAGYTPSGSGDCGCPNKKGFNGNEIQNKEFSDGGGLNLYDFNARTYDQQVGRFIQVDPKGEDEGQESLTPYQFSLNNPIRYNDPDGKCPICPFIPFIIKAFVAGAAIDAGTQVVTNKIQGQSWSQSLNSVDLKQSAISGGFSVLSGGSSNFVGGTKVATAVTKAFVKTGLEVGESVTKQYVETGTVSLKQTVSDVVMDKAGGALTKNVNVNGVRSAENTLDRANRVASGDPTSAGRQQALRDAGNNLTTQQTKANAASAVAGNGLQEVSNGVRHQSGTRTGVPTPLKNGQFVDNASKKPVMLLIQ